MKLNKLFSGIIAIFFFLTSWFLIFNYQIPFRLYNSDIFHQLAIISEFDNLHNNNIPEPYFSEGPVDLHAGPYYFLLYLIAKASNVTYYNIILVAAFSNTIFLACSLYFFAVNFGLSKNKSIVFSLCSIFGWGTFGFFFAGIFEYSNLIVTGSFPATVGLSLILIILSLSKKYLRNQKVIYLVLIIVLTSSLLMSHLLSGIILFSFIMLVISEEVIVERKITKNSLSIFSIIPISIIISFFIWPLFNLLDLVSSAKTVQVGASEQVKENLFEIDAWPLLIGTAIIGIVFSPSLLQKKKYFIFFLLLSSMIMTASYLLPVRVSLYWRYFPFITIAIFYTLIDGIKRMNHVLGYILLSIIIATGIVNTTSKINLLLLFNVNDGKVYKDISHLISKDSVVLSDPNTSYHLAAFTEAKVVAVPYNHANPAYIPESKSRYEEVINSLTTNQSLDKQKKIVDKYNITHILINKNYYPDYMLLSDNREWVKKITIKLPNNIIYDKGDFKIYQLH